jgi:hypothetical protein
MLGRLRFVLAFLFVVSGAWGAVSSEVSRTDYVGNGSLAAYSTTFPVKATTELRVFKQSADGQDVELALGVDYSAVVNASGLATITLTAGNLTNGYKLSLQRGIPYTQTFSPAVGGPYNAASVANALDRLSHEIIRLKGDVDRAIKIPYLEAGGDSVTKIDDNAANRANQTLVFDSSGNASVGAVTNATASVFGQSLIDDTSASEARTTLGLSGAYALGLSVINVKDPAYGAVGDGVTDDTAAVALAVAATTSGKALYFPAGTYNLSSATLASSPFTMPAGNVLVFGEGNGVSKLVVTGTTVCNYIFGWVNKSNIQVRDLWMYGNSQASGFINGIALSWVNTGASAELEGYHVKNCRFTNFKGDSWVYAENLAGTYGMRNISVTGCTFESLSGNARGPTSVAIPQGCIGIWGHNSNANGWLKDIRIEGNTAYCTYCKGLSVMFGNIQRFSIANNTIFDVGSDAAFTDDSGCYTIVAYNNFLPPRYGSIIGNRIIGCRDTGMYLLGSIDMTVMGNWIYNQTSVADVTLVKAAIAISEGARYNCIGNTIHNCRVGISFQGTGSAIESNHDSVIAHNVIRGAARAGIKVDAGPTRPLTNLKIDGNMVHDGSTHGIWVDIQSTTDSSGIEITNNNVRASQIGINLASGDGSYNLADCRISGNRVSGSGTAHIFARSWDTGPIIIENNHLIGNSSPSLDLISNTKVVVKGNVFYNVNAGNYCIYSGNAQGEMWGNQFNNVATGLKVSPGGSEDLGLDAPTWTGTIGMRVQYCDPAVVTNGHLRLGWLYTNAGWVEELTVSAVLQGSATYDPPNLADGAGATTTVTVTGAALGDFAEAAFSLDLQGISVTAWVSGVNTVSVRFQNESGGALDLASGTLRARVRKQ